MIAKCPVCRKQFDILWPHLYRYKINKKYFCSWTCYRLKQSRKKEDEMNKPKQKRPRMTPDEMATAMQIWRDGGDIDGYLTAHGIGNIQKWKANARVRKPAEAPKPKTAGDAMEAIKETADNFFSQCEEMGLNLGKDATPKPISGGEWERMETPESKLTITTTKPLEFRVTGISTSIGDFQFYKRNGYLDWTPIGDNSVISLQTEEWKELIKQLPSVIDVLGVKL